VSFATAATPQIRDMFNETNRLGPSKYSDGRPAYAPQRPVTLCYQSP
jgi:hypothetical protein